MQTNINPNINCNKPDCLLCIHSEKRTNCSKSCVVYKITCLKCKETILHTYDGETSRSAYTRGSEHCKDFYKKLEKCPLFRHYRDYHDNEPMNHKEFKMVVVKQYQNDSQGRVLREALEIKYHNPNYQMNSKCEYKQPRVVKPTFVQTV